jgi:diguanylate cyclase (GGDEF)-like protein/PAS domain S-box-containing protein
VEERGAHADPGHDLPPPEQLAAMATHLTETVELVGTDGKVRWRLGPARAVRGLAPRKAGRSTFEFVHPDDLPRMMEFGTAVTASEPGWHGSLLARLRRDDGTWRPCAIEVVNRTDDPILQGVIVKTRELPTGPVTLAADRLDLDDEAMVESIAEAVPVALIVLDRIGRMEFANHVARETCDLPDGPTFGRYLPDLAVESDRSAVARVVGELLEHGGSRTVVFETRGWRGTAARRVLEARLLARGLTGPPSLIIVTLDDVTERRREEDDLRRRANYDPLTGLLNRAALLEEVEARLARGSLTAIYCDLDGFKEVNDTFGHAGGDELLVEVAKRLASMARSSDAIGRIGGDEFVIVCDGLAKPHITNLIERIGDALVAGLGVRISVGVASSRKGGSAHDLLARADQAMYEDKRRIYRRKTDGPQLR